MRATSTQTPPDLGTGGSITGLPTSADLRWADPEDQQWVDRLIIRVTAAVMVFTWWLVLTSPTLLTGHYPWAYEATGLGLLAAWYAVLVTAAVRGSGNLRILWPLPPLVLVLLVGMLLVPTGPPALQGQVWLTHPATIAVNIGLLILPWRVALPLIVSIATALTLVHSEWMHLPQAIAQTAAIMVGPYVVFLISGHLLARLLQLRAASADRATAVVRAQESRHLADQKAYWDRLIHDHVLGALVLGHRATTEESLAHARDAAREALASLEAPAAAPPQDDWVRRLDLFARSRGLVPTTVVVGLWAPPEVSRALAAAGRQAIENVARHAGVTAVRIGVTQSPDSVVLTIADDGRGFDLESVESTRMGLNGSIPGHVHAVGGSMRVTSAPGHGTTVTLGWGGRSSSAPRLPVLASSPWPSQQLIVLAWAAIHGTLGALYLDGVVRPWLSASGALLYLAGLAVLLLGSFRRFVPAVCVGLLASSVLLAAGAEPIDAADGRLWFCGALLPLVVVLILVGRVVWGMALGLGSAVLVTGTWLALGGPPAAQAAAVAALQLVAFPLVCLLLGVALNRTAGRIAQAGEETARERIAESESAARIAEGDRRRAALDRDAIPLLHRLRSATSLSKEDREALRLAEGSTRDLLVAAPLVDDRVRLAAAEARRRGARVSLSAEDVDPAAPTPGTSSRTSSDRAPRVSPGPAPRGSSRPDSGSTPRASSGAASRPAPGASSGSRPGVSSRAAAPDRDRALHSLREVVALLLPACGEGSEIVVRWHPGSRPETASVVLDAPTCRIPQPELSRALRPVPHELTVTADDLFLRLLDEPGPGHPG